MLLLVGVGESGMWVAYAYFLSHDRSQQLQSNRPNVTLLLPKYFLVGKRLHNDNNNVLSTPLCLAAAATAESCSIR